MLHRYHSLLFRIALAISLISLLIGLGVLLPLPRSGQAQTGPENEEETEAEPPPPLVELNEDVIKRATVFIMQTYNTEGQPNISCVGSGTLVSADGLILTNAHNALPSEMCPADTLVIAVTVRLDEPPIPTYTAEIVDASRGLDLAILRINGHLDGRGIEPGSLQLPFVELGDSEAVALDDTITIIGYPNIGNDPVSVERGTVSGFTAEARTGDRAWIRTSATIPGTMSGSGAYNRDGKLVGIPTIAPARSGGVTVDCRVIQDTNRDGRADQNDTCVPVGGFISALRPSRLARGLVRATALGIRQGEELTGSTAAATAGSPVFSRPFFSTRINEAGVPANVVSGVPGGIDSLYLFFDYDNMVDGLIYELRVTVDDVPDAIYSLPPVTWSGGARGTWYIGSSGTPWRNGFYDFRLFIEGREATSARILIGGGPRDNPAFSDIIFGLLDADGNLAGTNYVLPEGSGIQARFNYRNMAPGTPWTHRWFYEGTELFRNDESWDGGDQGTRIITAQADFLPGQYRLELYIESVLSATADFVIAGGAEVASAVIFDNFRFATDVAEGAPAGTIRSEFSAGTERLYTFFDWRLLAPGTTWTRRWLVDGDVLFEVTGPWDAGPDGQNYFVSLDSLGTLPDGTYGLEISIANVVLHSVTAKVGLGQLPVEAFASAAGAQMVGRITDADTGQGIPGAMFIVLDAEYSIEDFTWTQAQVLGVSLADSQGYFQIPALLPRGTLDEPILYSVLARAEGYLPLSADGIIVVDQTKSPVEINVELSRN
ncbi:MAG: trypsin-like peptidase domain-containing protein [Anaerolineae bacterium]|nr:trypsin-like peptidase domain-containing protein [Anaerolineae bacterium]